MRKERRRYRVEEEWEKRRGREREVYLSTRILKTNKANYTMYDNHGYHNKKQGMVTMHVVTITVQCNDVSAPPPAFIQAGAA